MPTYKGAELQWGHGSRYELAMTYFPELKHADGNCVDVGCGGISSQWKDHFDEYLGVDFPDSYKGIDLAGLADSFMFKNFDDGELTGVPAAANVLCLDVIEHCSDPYKLVSNLLERTEDILVISLPNNWFGLAKQIANGKSTYRGYGLPPDGFFHGSQHKFFFNTDEALAFVRARVTTDFEIVKVVIDLRKGRSGGIFKLPIIGSALTLVALPREKKFKEVFGDGFGVPLHAVASAVTALLEMGFSILWALKSEESKRIFVNSEATGCWFLVRKRQKNV